MPLIAAEIRSCRNLLNSNSIKKWLTQAFEVIYYLSGEGSWKLLAHEKLILMAAIENLVPDERELLRQQLHQDFFVERTNNRISVLRFYEAHEDLRVQGTDFEDRWIRVHMLVNGKKQICNVNVYRGLVFSVETRSPRKTYKGTEIRVVKVVDGNGADSFTRAIDRQEHGTG
ncbi:hypothetical protein [Ruegeria meonggei]|uniref:hypothetical protein n=1 Tax=Ruegeria meonggei TaxID=1446476 RepID=UPI00366E1817